MSATGRTVRFKTAQVHQMPRELSPGILYVSKEFGTSAHLCACGCGFLIRLFLKNINKLYTIRGWKDTAVFSSSRFTYPGMEAEFPGKVTEMNYDGTSHTGRNGITQNPRVVADVVRVLTDMPELRAKLNYGKLE